MNDITYYQKKVLTLKTKVTEQPKEFEVPKVELSENIKKFDRKVKVHTSDPFAFNTLTKKVRIQETGNNQTASQMITDPTYNAIGKFLGVDTVHDWGKYYDKVYLITEWARKKVGSSNIKISKWLSNKLNRIPSMGAKRIDDLYITARLEMEKK